MNTILPTWTADLENGVWTIIADYENGTPIEYRIEDEVLSDLERHTLERGTSDDIRNLVNNCGMF